MDHRHCSTGHAAPFQAGADKTHAALATRARGNGADIRPKSSTAVFLLVSRQHRKAGVRRAARALLSGLGERETQTSLFHLTNSCSFPGRFSSAQAGERQTCRGTTRARRQQIDPAALPAPLTEEGAEPLPAASWHAMRRWKRLQVKPGEETCSPHKPERKLRVKITPVAIKQAAEPGNFLLTAQGLRLWGGKTPPSSPRTSALRGAPARHTAAPEAGL